MDARRSLCAGLGMGGVLLGCAAASANIVVNGDFETPVIGQLFVPCSSGSTLITGWTVSAPTATQGVDLISESFTALNIANTGVQAIDMAGTPGRGSIWQDLPTTPGEWYHLTFWVSSNGGAIVGGLTVLWAGAPVITIDSPAIGTWQQVSIDLPYTDAATTRLTLQGNIDGNAGTFLDTVSVAAVPGPGGGLVMLMAVSMVRARHQRSHGRPGSASGR